MRQKETYTLPDYFVCYLMYGDHSGLEDHEIERIDTFIEKQGLGWLVYVSDTIRDVSTNDFDNLFGDVREYTFEVK